MRAPRLLPLLTALLACALLLAACGGDEGGETGSGTTSTPAQTTSTATTAAEETCKEVEQPKAKEDAGPSKAPPPLDRGKSYVARVQTSCGDFEITLDPKDSPKTGGAFVGLARDGFFDGLTFHRIVPNFVIQGGDPEGTGQGGPEFSVVEAPPEDTTYGRGVVAMAKTQAEDPGTSGSQFFVVTGQDAGLPPEYAVLGEVTDGMDAIDRIAAAQVDPATERPLEPVVIDRVTITQE